MGDRQPLEDGLAQGGDLDQDFAPVDGTTVAADHAERGQAVDEADHRVVLELELPGQGADGRSRAGRQPLDRQQELVLLGLEARAAGLALAEHQEAADEVAEPRETLVVWFANPG